MKKAPLYSRSRRDTFAAAHVVVPLPAVGAIATAPTASPPPAPASNRSASRRRRVVLARLQWALVGALVAAGLVFGKMLLQPGSRPLTQKDINAAVRHSLENEPQPSPYTRAYEKIRPSVVRVVGSSDDNEDEDTAKTVATPRSKQATSVGSGVIMADNGTILTNLHVVARSKRVKVTFFDGLESDAEIVSAQPENDLAVLKAARLPDDMEVAVMRSTEDLAPGDRVMAVGYPFGIGPSASSGVVSGLKREFRSPEGQRSLSNLIQFDAAANPGNSGGPLVTMEGEVVGIVTAILNPNEQRTFVGIAFAVPIENAAAAAGIPPF